MGRNVQEELGWIFEGVSFPMFWETVRVFYVFINKKGTLRFNSSENDTMPIGKQLTTFRKHIVPLHRL